MVPALDSIFEKIGVSLNLFLAVQVDVVVIAHILLVKMHQIRWEEMLASVLRQINTKYHLQ
jgi:hypothetical protein